MMTNACLYIVATPIGNLADLSIRAKETLSKVDVIAAEDTRNTKKLFSLIGISLKKKFIAYEDHFEQKKVDEIIEIIKNGQSVALVSDAGSPLISDPGYKLVRECKKQNIKVTTIPGCCAVISALQLSGLPTNRFMFAGFVPNKEKARLDLFNELKSINTTLVFYETANRLDKTLQVIEKIIPNREISIVREITKLHEECILGKPSNIRTQITEPPLKGEIVLVIAPPQEDDIEETNWEEILKNELKKSTLKDAVKQISETYKIKKSDVYDKALQIKNNTI